MGREGPRQSVPTGHRGGGAGVRAGGEVNKAPGGGDRAPGKTRHPGGGQGIPTPELPNQLCLVWKEVSPSNPRLETNRSASSSQGATRLLGPVMASAGPHITLLLVGK